MDMRMRLTTQLGALLLSNLEAQQTVEDLQFAVMQRDAKIAEKDEQIKALTPAETPADAPAKTPEA